MSGEVKLESRLNRTVFQALPSPQKLYVLIDIVPTGAGVAVQMPVNLGLVLDRSGSMAGDKIRKVREAVKLVLGRLSPQDLVSIVLFDDNVDTLVACQPVANLAQLHAQIDRITDRGGTTMSKGMRRGLDEMRQGVTPDRVSRMLLLTDGETFGDEDQCRQLATEAGQYGIPVSALGLGEEWNMPLLEAVAGQSGGVVDHLETPDSILAEFQRTVATMQGSVARNAQLTLRLVTGVSPAAAWRVLPAISQLNQRTLSDRDIQLILGDLEQGKGQSVLVEVIVQPKAAGAYRVAQADVMYDMPAAGLTGQHVRQDILVTLTDDPSQVTPFVADVMNLVEKVSVFKLQTRALSEAQTGNVALATQQLRAAATRLLNLGEADLAQAAEQEANNLEQQGQMSASGTKKLQYGTRKLTQRLDDLES
ncbi:MAG: VWA domain-containing protein [Caldilineaceae bacterium]|nr:VWA domain-containing protein [Caldilineaceae bacterium]